MWAPTFRQNFLVDDKEAEQAATNGNENIYKGIKKGYTNPHIV